MNTQHRPVRSTGLLLLGAWLATSAMALEITQFSPQGEIAKIEQVSVQFDQPAVPLGDPQATAPLKLQCQPVAKGSGRWLSERQWVFDFENSLPAGTRCTSVAAPGFRSPQGLAITGRTAYAFGTGGPVVQRTWPGDGATIAEDQHFVVRFAGQVTRSSLLAQSWCELDGVGERLPVQWVGGAARAATLKARGIAAKPESETPDLAVLDCGRRLSASAPVKLVLGAGISTPNGVKSRQPQVNNYGVREPFSLEFSCQRENAQAACLPLRPMTLSFSAPVARERALAIRLASQDGGATTPAQIDEDDKGQSHVSGVQFRPPFPENARYRIMLPGGFVDDAERTADNAPSFPLDVATGPMPPLAKFAASPFGVIERLAEPDGQALLPVTVRNVEAALQIQGLPVGQVSALALKADADIIAWLGRLERFERGSIGRKEAQAESRTPVPPALGDESKHWVETRSLSLLHGLAPARQLQLPRADAADPRPFEVVGIPLPPGFHVLEIASPQLGAALLNPERGANRTMYVRTSALVTNLGVHFKRGRDNALVWVTTLDKGRPVGGAQVRISTCQGKTLASATTDSQGIARFDKPLPEAPRCDGVNDGNNAYFVSARAQGVDGVADLAFVWSHWDKGIESWRFNLPTSDSAEPDQRVHTVLDRTLLRAGEKVSMKHLVRVETRTGLTLPPAMPQQLVITHQGSGQEVKLPLVWRKTRSGGQVATSEWQVPPAAKLGLYRIALETTGPKGQGYDSGSFRVEEFRLPVFEGSLTTNDKKPLIAVTAVPVSLQVSYLAGGPAAGLATHVSALLRNKLLRFDAHEGFSFYPPRPSDTPDGASGGDDDSEEGDFGATDNSDSDAPKVVADKLPLKLGAQGQGKTVIDRLPASARPRELVIEASYADPNGEVQTLRQVGTIWPAAVVAGIQADDWIATGKDVALTALALNLEGKPQRGVKLSVRAQSRTFTTTRKRMVGGFYTYDNQAQTEDLGTVCSGSSDANGLLHCTARLGQAGEVELTVTATDSDGRIHQSATSVYVTRQGDIWFGGQDHDRMDVIAEQKHLQPGDTARLQVRMPFRSATALVSIEREGVMETRVVQLSGQNPTIELQVGQDWGPNVYVSVLAVRGRIREVPWYSFFTWGFKAPRAWWTAFWYDGKEYIAPTALVDLSKPAYRLGVAELQVGVKAHEIAVTLTPDRTSYKVRETASVRVQATLPNGQPAAFAELTLAAVDQALLELSPNPSWQLLAAMFQRRSWGVQTSTAQMEIIGRRHYGRKAIPAGGGGGRSPTRELFDTLLTWQPSVVLDAQGQATVQVPLNDTLGRFEVVAIVEAGTSAFGTGRTALRTAQDLQLISGLPPLVREGDPFRAQFTLRNTTDKPMQLSVNARATGMETAPQSLELAAGESREIQWDVTAPVSLGQGRLQALLWEIEANDSASGASDSMKVSQRIVPAVPLAVQQATLVQLDGPLTWPVRAPAQAQSGADGALRGGLSMFLQPSLADGLPAVKAWFADYPFACLEQKASKATGLRDAALWKTLAEQLPTYLDTDGLANYFPPRDGEASQGSDTLTAHLLAVSHEMSGIDPTFTLPAVPLAAMQRGLTAFVEGRIERKFWSPRADLAVRKLAAIEALSRYRLARPSMLQSLAITPQSWPTHAVIDWLQILQRLPDAPQRADRLKEAQQTLRARLSQQGTRTSFSTERDDDWWWLMQNADVNAARLLLAVMDEPDWKVDMGRLASGLVGRQERGVWPTTTANLWGGLALEKFSARFESTPVQGKTVAKLGEATASVDWAQVKKVDAEQAPAMGAAPSPTQGWLNNHMALPWPKATAPSSLNVTQEGTGKPWLTVQSVAAVQRAQPLFSGYQVRKTITPLAQKVKGRYSRGDVLRITLDITASTDMTWVVVSDPVPGGASILGNGLGRDSVISTQGEQQRGNAWPAFEERSFEAYRSYYRYLPKGSLQVQYTLRLNNVGDFAVPPTRVEALYAPEVFGEAPNPRIRVEAAP
ncbi:MG2 domain-containing protein [Hydrogenophaga sp. PAMC20947]|uniref:alpha-2-macroglobulin family protein n=1 Tax=Hydrogenophaga sp. PAMC20947 TaxID=2565558 RepID=UPI0032B527F8